MYSELINKISLEQTGHSFYDAINKCQYSTIEKVVFKAIEVAVNQAHIAKPETAKLPAAESKIPRKKK